MWLYVVFIDTKPHDVVVYTQYHRFIKKNHDREKVL